MTYGIARDHLRAFIERIERVEGEIAELNSDKRDIYAEAKGNGFDVATIKKVVRLRKLDSNERAEADALLDTYMAALGMLPATRAPAHDPITGEAHDEPSEGDAQYAHPSTEPQVAPQPAQTDHALAVTPPPSVVEPEAVESSTPHSPETAERGAGPETAPASDDDAVSPAASSSTIVPFHTAETREQRTLRMRPYCQRPSACAGTGRDHCFTCRTAMQETPEPAA